jgi:hypothetical protein
LRENRYQAELIGRIRDRWPDCIIQKLDSGYTQGIPDLLVLIGPFWATLEVKAREDAVHQPNQDYYVERMNHMGFSAFIYPDNEERVLDGLQQALESVWSTLAVEP